MERTLIADLKERVGQEVQVMGWVDVRRDQGKMVFFDFRDRSGRVQGVVLPQSPAMEVAKEVKNEYVVAVVAKVNKRPEKNVNDKVQNGDIELEITGITVLAKAEFPFEKDADLNLDTYLDHLPLTLRGEKHREVFKLQATLIAEFRASLNRQGFTEFQSPAITGGDAEGGAATFKVDYYGHKANLATSPQLYKQIMAGVFERVYTTPKIFRAEKSTTTRHLSEVTQMDFEMAFISDHRDVMAVLTQVMRDVSAAAPEPFKMPAEIPSLKLREVQRLLGVSETEPDLEPEHERELSRWALEKHNSDFVYVTHFPVEKTSFYAFEDPDDQGYSRYFDLLFRGLEIVSGGQRVHEHDTLVGALKRKGLDPQKFGYYLQAFKGGMPPHGGCSTGLERLTMKILGLSNVREATLFPRDMNRIDTLFSERE